MAVLVNTAYLPPIQYIAAIAGDSIASVEAMETYRKQTCRNHCVIHGPQGRHVLTVPVVKVNGNHTLTRDVLISEHEPWQKIHWRSICTAYNNSPFFLYYGDLFEPLFSSSFNSLLELNSASLTIILDLLKIQVSVKYTTGYEKEPSSHIDFREILVSNKNMIFTNFPHYTQVFEPANGFIPNLSILDLIFNLGPESGGYIKNLIPKLSSQEFPHRI